MENTALNTDIQQLIPKLLQQLGEQETLSAQELQELKVKILKMKVQSGTYEVPEDELSELILKYLAKEN